MNTGVGRISASVKRKLAQLAFTFLTNANLAGFASGRVYSGKLKTLCVPGLNCYSCPGALGACPMGALQTALADPAYKSSFYVTGVLAAFGIILGRAACGWLCPFGLFQELLHLPAKIAAKRSAAIRKLLAKQRLPFVLRYIKHAVLLLFVIVLPVFWTDAFGFGAPYFCEFICPSGTIMGALPLLAAAASLRALIGALFYLKISIAAFVVSASVASNRFFCKYLCPLGAVYGLFNRVSLIRLRYDAEKCVACGRCAAVCGMGVDPRDVKRRAECICCGKCVKICAYGALRIETPASAYVYCKRRAEH